MSAESGRLVPLSETTEFRLRPDAPDVRGWSVATRDGTRVGIVAELLVDPGAGRVRYLELELSPHGGMGPGRHALIPIGVARADRDADIVIIPDSALKKIGERTHERGEVVTREYEMHVHLVMVGTSIDVSREGADHYAGESYDERRFLSDRAREDDDDDFSYLVGVGGAMTSDDERPEVVGEMSAGQIRVPVIEEQTSHRVAPEEETRP